MLCCAFQDNSSLSIILNYRYNEDVHRYEIDVPSGLCGSIPFMIGHRKGMTCGFMWNNPSKTYIDVWREVSSTHTHTYIYMHSWILYCHVCPSVSSHLL